MFWGTFGIFHGISNFLYIPKFSVESLLGNTGLGILTVVPMKNRHLGCNANPVDLQNFRWTCHIIPRSQEINQCFTRTCCLMITVVSTLDVGTLCTDESSRMCWWCLNWCTIHCWYWCSGVDCVEDSANNSAVTMCHRKCDGQAGVG